MPTLIPLDNILGAALIGIMASTTVYGITCLQVYLYYTQYCARDSLFMKVFVAFVMTMDTFHVALLGTFYYFYTVTNFGDYAALSANTWSILAQIVLGAFMTGVVQFFFAWRVWRLSNRNIWCPLVICLLGAGQLGLALGYIATVVETGTSPTADANIPYSLGGLVLAILCDVLITVCMIYWLYKSRTSFAGTNKAITLLITYSLNTGLLTSTMTAACLIAWVVTPKTLVYAAFYFVLVRLYSCSLMSTLNSRTGVREVLHGGSRDRDFVSFSGVSAPVDISEASNAPPDKTWPDHSAIALYETNMGSKVPVIHDV